MRALEVSPQIFCVARKLGREGGGGGGGGALGAGCACKDVEGAAFLALSPLLLLCL